MSRRRFRVTEADERYRFNSRSEWPKVWSEDPTSYLQSLAWWRENYSKRLRNRATKDYLEETDLGKHEKTGIDDARQSSVEKNAWSDAKTNTITALSNTQINQTIVNTTYLPSKSQVLNGINRNSKQSHVTKTTDSTDAIHVDQNALQQAGLFQ